MGIIHSKIKEHNLFAYSSMITSASTESIDTSLSSSNHTQETPIIRKVETENIRPISKNLKKLYEIDANDPRSPNQFICRTPIHIPIETDRLLERKLIHEIDDLDQIDDQHQQKPNYCLIDEPIMDPRSPSLHIDRTPFCFGENASSASSSDSNRAKSNVSPISEQIELTPISKLMKTRIFEDVVSENENNKITPIKSVISDKIVNGGNRTPLGCLGNKNHPRSILKEATHNYRIQNKNKENFIIDDNWNGTKRDNPSILSKRL